MLLTLIINSLNCTMLLIAIQTQKPGFNPQESGMGTQPYHLVLGGVSIHISTETLALGRSHKHLK